MNPEHAENQEFPLHKVQLYNWLLLVMMSLAAWLAYSVHAAQSIVTGALIACISFELMKKDLTKLMKGPVHAVKGRFLIKYYARLSVLIVLLYFIIRYANLSIIGLLVGLSTVVLSIGLTVATERKRFFFNLEEAS